MDAQRPVDAARDVRSSRELTCLLGGAIGDALGRTEIPLIINDANSPLPVMDSARLLAHAALRRAVEADSGTPRNR